MELKVLTIVGDRITKIVAHWPAMRSLSCVHCSKGTLCTEFSPETGQVRSAFTLRCSDCREHTVLHCAVQVRTRDGLGTGLLWRQDNAVVTTQPNMPSR